MYTIVDQESIISHMQMNAINIAGWTSLNRLIARIEYAVSVHNNKDSKPRIKIIRFL